ncbi:hypothetical protein AN618_04040 [Fervidicola ferrireducens]|uniref:O-antigen ligase-related domain-containing protein n=1 Tax=Fervidicola ferrireducens TaxID=520764 RepID=A0A140LCR3_9FIRM|nr:O-antigen ligase [Fervidicola ferrireducens]KXG78338.1 hypothetical protein AN618_04040 [Fervidicola ferrireducens]
MLRLRTLERLFVLISLLLLSSDLLPLWRRISGFDFSVVEGDPLQRAVFAGIFTVSFLLLILRSRRTLDTLRAGIFLWPLLGWALLSVLWSEVPEVTIRREIALLGTTVFGIYLASRFEHGEFLRLLGWTLLISVVLSYLFIFLIPDWGIMEDTRGEAWCGIYVHKNGLGRMAALAAIVFLLLTRSEPRRRYVWWSSLILAIGLLLGSRSATALVVLISLLLFLPVIKILRMRYDLVIPLLIMLVMVAGALTWFISTNIEKLLEILGRDATLTGRTYLWEAVIFMASQRPWLGYGYEAFWLGWDGPSALVWQSISFQAPHAHNSFLDLWLTLGFIGIGLFAISYLTALGQALKSLKKTEEYLALWPTIYLLFMLLYSISESSILRQYSVLWVLYVAVVLGVDRGSYRTDVRAKREGIKRYAVTTDIQ